MGQGVGAWQISSAITPGHSDCAQTRFTIVSLLIIDDAVQEMH